jgi:RimJ/RimL family protein N-acetyltransferase
LASYHLLYDADDDVGAWIFARTRGTWIKGQGVAIGITCAESLVAGAAFTMYNGANVWAAIAADPSHQGHWATRRILRALFDYPFRQLKCKRMSSLLYASNDVAIKFNERLGFTREATLEDAAPEGDMFLYRLTREDCRWIPKIGVNNERRRLTPSGPRLHRDGETAGTVEP